MSNEDQLSGDKWTTLVVAAPEVAARVTPILQDTQRFDLHVFESLEDAFKSAEDRNADAIFCERRLLEATGEPRQWRSASRMLPLILLTETAPSIAENESLLKHIDDCLPLDEAHPETAVRVVQNALNMHSLHNQFRQVLAESPDGVVVVDATGIVLYANSAASLLLGRKTHDMLNESFGIPVTADSSTEVDLPNGRTAEMRVVDIDWLGESAFLASLRDVTDRKLAEAKLIQAAERDSLTALPNRAHFQSELSKAIAWAAERQKHLAVLFIDLDKFKSINDTLGHDAGDRLLRMVADRLLAASRTDTIVGRLGGDEFVALARGLEPGGEMAIAERFMQNLSAPFKIGEQSLNVSASIGVATYPYSGKNAHALIMAADAAMYTAKEGGRNQIKLFSREAGTATARRKQMEAALRQALTRDEFSLVYQPMYDIEDGSRKAHTCEALLRWSQPELGAISPDEFIPLAETSGWIEAIDHWVIVQVCRQLSTWNNSPHADKLPRCVSINVSTRQLKDVRFPEFVSRVMQETGVAASQLWLEITETGLMHNIDECIEVLTELRALGLKIAVDDFGTGYSSLAYLQRLPIDVIKIDRAFITGIGSTSGDSTIVNSVMQIAKSLDLLVVAEGVETQAEYDCLQALGCDVIQGYLLARPMQDSTLVPFLTK